MMIDEQVQAGHGRRLVLLLYFYVLYSHQTHSYIHTHLSHPPLTGLVGRHNCSTPHHTTPYLYAEKYRLHRRRRLYIEQAADMGLGRFFCLLKITRTDKTCSGTNTNSQHAFVHLTGPMSS